MYICIYLHAQKNGYRLQWTVIIMLYIPAFIPIYIHFKLYENIYGACIIYT